MKCGFFPFALGASYGPQASAVDRGRDRRHGCWLRRLGSNRRDTPRAIHLLRMQAAKVSMTSRPSTAAPILAVLAVVLVTLGGYVGEYFWLSDCRIYVSQSDTEIIRSYPKDWMRVVFTPGGWLEAKTRRASVWIQWSENEDPFALPFEP